MQNNSKRLYKNSKYIAIPSNCDHNFFITFIHVVFIIIIEIQVLYIFMCACADLNRVCGSPPAAENSY